MNGRTDRVSLEEQEKLIQKREWDTLIILDACRYDYFERVYKRFSIEGKLSKVKSSGYNSPRWFKNTFSKTSFNDTVYISGNPYINSKNVGFGTFNGSDIFHKVIDVWEFGWNEDLQTVAPQTISKEARRAKMNLPDKRLICHFCQPHGPYLSIGPIEKVKSDNDLEKRLQKHRTRSFRSKVGKFLERILGKLNFHKMRAKLGFKISGTCARVARKYGEKELKRAYKNNLEAVLSEVEKIVERFPQENRIVITADHGELLGEDGLYGHGYPHPLLRNVPWFEIEG